MDFAAKAGGSRENYANNLEPVFSKFVAILFSGTDEEKENLTKVAISAAKSKFSTDKTNIGLLLWDVEMLNYKVDTDTSNDSTLKKVWSGIKGIVDAARHPIKTMGKLAKATANKAYGRNFSADPATNLKTQLKVILDAVYEQLGTDSRTSSMFTADEINLMKNKEDAMVQFLYNLIITDLSDYNLEHLATFAHYMTEVISAHQGEQVLAWLRAKDPNYTNESGNNVRRLTITGTTTATKTFDGASKTLAVNEAIDVKDFEFTITGIGSNSSRTTLGYVKDGNFTVSSTYKDNIRVVCTTTGEVSVIVDDVVNAAFKDVEISVKKVRESSDSNGKSISKNYKVTYLNQNYEIYSTRCNVPEETVNESVAMVAGDEMVYTFNKSSALPSYEKFITITRYAITQGSDASSFAYETFDATGKLHKTDDSASTYTDSSRVSAAAGNYYSYIASGSDVYNVNGIYRYDGVGIYAGDSYSDLTKCYMESYDLSSKVYTAELPTMKGINTCSYSIYEDYYYNAKADSYTLNILPKIYDAKTDSYIAAGDGDVKITATNYSDSSDTYTSTSATGLSFTAKAYTRYVITIESLKQVAYSSNKFIEIQNVDTSAINSSYIYQTSEEQSLCNEYKYVFEVIIPTENADITAQFIKFDYSNYDYIPDAAAVNHTVTFTGRWFDPTASDPEAEPVTSSNPIACLAATRLVNNYTGSIKKTYTSIAQDSDGHYSFVARNAYIDRNGDVYVFDHWKVTKNGSQSLEYNEMIARKLITNYDSDGNIISTEVGGIYNPAGSKERIMYVVADIENNYTFEPVYEKASYNYSVTLSDGTVKTGTAKVGEEVTVKDSVADDVIKTSWSGSYKAVTYTAIANSDDYTVTVSDSDTAVSDEDYYYDDVDDDDIPELTFVMPAGDVTFKATTEKKEFIVEVDGGIVISNYYDDDDDDDLDYDDLDDESYIDDGEGYDEDSYDSDFYDYDEDEDDDDYDFDEYDFDHDYDDDDYDAYSSQSSIAATETGSKEAYKTEKKLTKSANTAAFNKSKVVSVKVNEYIVGKTLTGLDIRDKTTGKTVDVGTIKVIKDNTGRIVEFRFRMPSENLLVTPVYEDAHLYNIRLVSNIDDSTEYVVDEIDLEEKDMSDEGYYLAQSGDTLFFIPFEPDDYYVSEIEFIVDDEKLDANVVFFEEPAAEFEMPASDIEIRVTYERIQDADSGESAKTADGRNIAIYLIILLSMLALGAGVFYTRVYARRKTETRKDN